MQVIDKDYLLTHKRKVMFFGIGPDDESWGYAVPVEVIENAPTLTPRTDSERKRNEEIGGNIMSLYNMINGFNPACLLIMPMLGRKQEEWPRFRDCFVTDENNIAIYTRVGGGNRGCGYGEEELYKDPNFITTYDDDFDSTYATYEFSVPEKWKNDFNLIVSGKISEVSDEYISYLKEFFPLLAENGVIDKVFRPSSAEEMEMLEGMK